MKRSLAARPVCASAPHCRDRAARLRRAARILSVALCALVPSCAPPKDTIDLHQFTKVFEEKFADLDVSAWGPGTRWIAHTPWNGDFGDSAFADPRAGFPFSTIGGVGRIELRKTANGRWQSGLLASVDPKGNGFALQYGYFEMRAKLPSGEGVWPAFWLSSVVPPPSTEPSIEIDVMEAYGRFPASYNATVAVWPKTEKSRKWSTQKTIGVPSGSLSEAFHNYGVSVAPDWTVFYLDGKEMARVPTPPEHTHGLMILADLGLGSGWPIDRTPNPSFMYIEYIRAYAFKPKSA
jgi:beta-glucanase (GH16 family)